VEQRLKERSPRNCSIWGSTPYTATKLRYCRCLEVLADRSLIWLFPERWCQCLTNTEADACFHPIIRLSTRSQIEELEKELKDLRGFAAPWGSNSVNRPEPLEVWGLDHQPKSTHWGNCCSSCICGRRWPWWTSVRGVALGPEDVWCPSVGECQGKKAGAGALS
jgi:hypothetical protein